MQTLYDLKKKRNVLADRMSQAEKDFEKLRREIQPFVRKRRIRQETSAGKWIESSSLELLNS